MILMMSLIMCGAAFSCATPTNPDEGSPSGGSSSEITADSSDEMDTDSSNNAVGGSSSDGEKEEITVIFRQNGEEDIVVTVTVGESLTDIPTPTEKAGYYVVWDRTDFSNLAEDIMVNAIQTAKTYTVTLYSNGGVITQESITVTYGQDYALPAPIHSEHIFEYWTYAGEKVDAQGIWEIDAEDIRLTAQWNECHWSDNY